jgi:outer membrane immunogenic protein
MALAVLLAAGPAYAGDAPPAEIALAPISPPAFSWTGFYTGANAGYSMGDASFRITPTGAWAGAPGDIPFVDAAGDPDLGPNGFLGGWQIGVNYQTAPVLWSFPLVLGLEGDIDYLAASAGTSRGAVPTTSITNVYTQAQQTGFGTFRARIGVPFWQALLYATGGVAVSQWDLRQDLLINGPTNAASFSNTALRLGWTAGAGAEWMLTPQWSIKVEYLHADFGSVSGSSFFALDRSYTQTHRVSLSDDVVRVGVNYRFSMNFFGMP